MRRRVFVLLLLGVFLFAGALCLRTACTAPDGTAIANILDRIIPNAYGFMYFNSTEEPLEIVSVTPEKLQLDPNKELQPEDGELKWMSAAEYYFANFDPLEPDSMNQDTFQKYLTGLSDKDWKLVRYSEENGAQNYTFESGGEYILISWSPEGMSGCFYYGPWKTFDEYLLVPTPTPTLTPTITLTSTPAPTATPATTTTPSPTPTLSTQTEPVQGIPWPEDEFPPYIPAMQNVTVLGLDVADAYSGIAFTGCTEADFLQYQEDMIASGWVFHSSESDGDQYIYTGKTSLGEYLSIYWNSQTGEGKIYYGEVPTLK